MAIVFGFVVAITPSIVLGQISAKQLLAPAVKSYGPQYSDVERAVASFRAANFEECRANLTKARTSHPELAPVDIMLALLHLSVGKTAPAMAALDRAVINTPDDPEAYVLLADLALRDGQRTVADLGYRKAQEVLVTFDANERRKKSLVVRVHAGMASLCEVRGQYAQAEQHLKSWEKEDADNPLVHGSLGRIYFRLQEYEKARESFAKLTKNEDEAPPVEVAMGRLFHEVGMSDEATTQMQEAAKRYPDDLRVHLAVAAWAFSAGNRELAKASVAAAAKLSEQSVQTAVMSARLARIEGDLDEAESILNNVVLRNPTSFAATNELARVLANSDDPEKIKASLQYARRNYAAFAKKKSLATVESVVTYAWCLYRNERLADAEVALRMVPSGSNISPENTYYSGRIYLERGQRRAAISALRAATTSPSLFPGRSAANEVLAELTSSPK